ncbi:MAG TPA: FAD-dependent oxidoreductase [Solirubrobacterales bacterium]|nr:FAD-dependent oxidoreductase [Solirubrobacterales bacterium]
MRHDAHGHWIEEAGLEGSPSLPALTADTVADVAIVGGGYTGLWAAWWIKRQEPGARVVVLEADRCGFGPSGRNGGFVNSMSFSLPTLRRCFGDRGALAMVHAGDDSVRAIGDWCAEQEVDAWFVHGGYLQTSTAPHFDGAWDPVVAACAELGEEGRVELLDREAVRARCASPLFRCAAFYPMGATVHPARLAAGLRDRVRAAGVEIHEHTRVDSLRDRDGEVAVGTPVGRVVAGAAILAAGGSVLRFRPLRRSLTMTSSHMVITEPVPDLLEEIGWTGGECITDSRHMVHYFRTTRDGRIAFGWGGGRIVRGANVHGHAEVDPKVSADVQAHLRRFFPQLDGRPLAHAWGGPIDVSPTHLPIVRTLGERSFAGFGYTGHGVGPSQMVGHSLASMALDRRDGFTALPIIDPPAVSVPPEPLRYAGGAIIRRAIISKETAEEQDRVPGPIARVLSGIPERLGIHVGR